MGALSSPERASLAAISPDGYPASLIISINRCKPRVEHAACGGLHLAGGAAGLSWAAVGITLSWAYAGLSWYTDNTSHSGSCPLGSGSRRAPVGGCGLQPL